MSERSNEKDQESEKVCKRKKRIDRIGWRGK